MKIFIERTQSLEIALGRLYRSYHTSNSTTARDRYHFTLKTYYLNAALASFTGQSVDLKFKEIP